MGPLRASLFRPFAFSPRKRETAKGRKASIVAVATAKTGQDKTVTERQIDATDRQIDRLVYELYELSDEEIKIVEEATRQ